MTTAVRGRGVPQMVTERATTHVARLIEGQCFAAEVIATTAVIATAAAVGSRHVVVQEAGRLSGRADSLDKSGPLIGCAFPDQRRCRVGIRASA